MKTLLFLILHNLVILSALLTLPHPKKETFAQVTEVILVKVTSVFPFVKYNGQFLTFTLPNFSESCDTAGQLPLP